MAIGDHEDPVILTDNASNMNVAAGLAGMTHVRSFAHSLNAKEVLKALKPMKNATVVLSEESTPTLSVIATLYAKLVADTEESLDTHKTWERHTLIRGRYCTWHQLLTLSLSIYPFSRLLPVRPIPS